MVVLECEPIQDMDGHLDKTEMYLCLIELNECLCAVVALLFLLWSFQHPDSPCSPKSVTRQGLLDMGIKTRLPDPSVHTVDAIFSSLDDDGNGWIVCLFFVSTCEFSELLLLWWCCRMSF